MEVNKLFDNILDLPGIEGVCLFGTGGQMYVNRLPSFLSTELFADAQRRIVAMYETMDENFMPCDDYMLKFSERWVLMRRSENHVMLILGGDKANVASTRMVTNMTMKHLTPQMIAQLDALARGATSPVAPLAPVPAASAPAKSTRPPFSTASGGTTPAVATAALPVAAATAVVSAPVAAPAKPVRMYRGRPY
jgi:hypothetical protein